MTFPIRGLASQNWVVTPVPAATGVSIGNIADQEWLMMTLSGVVFLDLQGSNLHDWRRATVSLTGEELINGPMVFAIATYPIPLPDRGGEFFTGLQLQQSSLYAAVGSLP